MSQISRNSQQEINIVGLHFHEVPVNLGSLVRIMGEKDVLELLGPTKAVVGCPYLLYEIELEQRLQILSIGPLTEGVLKQLSHVVGLESGEVTDFSLGLGVMYKQDTHVLIAVVLPLGDALVHTEKEVLSVLPQGPSNPVVILALVDTLKLGLDELSERPHNPLDGHVHLEPVLQNWH